MQNKQYIHTNLLLYCSKKFYKFNQVSKNESEQRNFTHLIRCQNVKPYVIVTDWDRGVQARSTSEPVQIVCRDRVAVEGVYLAWTRDRSR
jgi:hypothetical protein